jgi:hypothetical protein
MKHNDAYLERIAQDLIRLQFWFDGHKSARGITMKLDNALMSLHQAVEIIREAKSDFHGSKGEVLSDWERDEESGEEE